MQEKKMTNCPACQKPVLNEGQFTAFTQFNIRCPWCQTTVSISVQPKIVAEIVRTTPIQREQVSGSASALKRFKLVGYAYQEEQEEKKPADLS